MLDTIFYIFSNFLLQFSHALRFFCEWCVWTVTIYNLVKTKIVETLMISTTLSADGGTWTRTSVMLTWTWIMRVCQFRHICRSFALLIFERSFIISNLMQFVNYFFYFSQNPFSLFNAISSFFLIFPDRSPSQFQYSQTKHNLPAPS